MKLPNGEWLIKGHKLTSFTNDEEEAVQLMGDMPFPLETKLKEHGAEFVGAENFTCNVVVSLIILSLISLQQNYYDIFVLTLFPCYDHNVCLCLSCVDEKGHFWKVKGR